MMRLAVVLSVAIVCLSAITEATNKCDQTIIHNIRSRFWNNGHTTPRRLLQEGASLSPVYVKATTKNYYADEHNISCIHVSFEDMIVNVYTHYKDSSEATTQYTITERDGVLVDKVNGVSRYYLGNSRGGVRAFYKCSTTGAVGAPEGLIEAAASGFEDAAVAKATWNLASLGIVMGDTAYDTTCAQ